MFLPLLLLALSARVSGDNLVEVVVPSGFSEGADGKMKEIFVTDGDNNPFALYMFENFELTRDVFEREKQAADELKRLRIRLRHQREQLEKESDPSDLSLVDEESAELLNSLKLWLDPPKKPEKNLTAEEEAYADRYGKNSALDEHDFPDARDFTGALNGLVILFDTYRFDMADFAGGRIFVEDFASGDRVDLAAAHNLTRDDLARLALHAFAKTWYDVSIHFTRAYFAQIADQPREQHSSLPDYDRMKRLRRNLVKLNNGYLQKRRTMADQDFKVLPQMVDDKLRVKAKQPKWMMTEGINLANTKTLQGREAYFRGVCRGFSERSYRGIHLVTRCGYLHHDDPFLRLAPFPFEVASESPYIIVVHDLFSEGEMRHLVETSRPRLSRSRHSDDANKGQLHEFKAGKRRRIVHKTVQHWLADVQYHNKTYDLEKLDHNRSHTVKDQVLFNLSKKIELATQLNTTDKYSATDYQVTNYGLGGLCETHIDPHGYIEGTVDLPKSRENLKRCGDMFGTIMGWIGDEPLGGATAFVFPNHEVTVWPRRGSAAFWFNLDRKGHRDARTNHGGCPVLKGSKWILNKWIFYFNQFHKFPCSRHFDEFVMPFQGHY